MADALASGASVRKDVGVQVPPRAPSTGAGFKAPVTPNFEESVDSSFSMTNSMNL